MKLLNTVLLQTQEVAETSQGIADQVTGFIAKLGLGQTATSIIGGLLMLIFGFFVAKYISGVIRRVIRRTGIDDRVGGDVSISKMIGKLIYFILMIFILMSALNIMGVGQEVLAPLNNMVNKFTSAMPNILTAGIIIYAGYFLAKIVSELVQFSGDAVQNATMKLKLPEGMDIVKIIKTVVFIFVFIPILIVGLEFLQFDAITKPATEMLSKFMNSIPTIIQAAAIILIAVFGGKFIASLLRELLMSLKVDSLSSKLGLDKVLSNVSLSNLLSNLFQYFIIYIGVMQAIDILGLDDIAEILNAVIAVAGKVFFGLIILVLGNVVANFASKIFAGSGAGKFTTSIMRAAIIVIFLAMGLSAMDIADSIINLAFGLGMGAIAVAFALSFGLGGKEAAGEEMKKFFRKLNEDK